MPLSAVRRHRLLLLSLFLGLGALLAACAAQPAATPTLTFLPSPTPTRTAPPSATATASQLPTSTATASPRPSITPFRTARPSNTPRPTPTEWLWPTPTAWAGTPSRLPLDPWATVTPIVPPAEGAARYILAPGSGAASLAVVDQLERYAVENNWIFPSNLNVGYTDAQPAIRLVAHAGLTLYPDSPEAAELHWRLARADAVSDRSDSDAWIIGQLEAELNAAGGDIAALPALALAHSFRVENLQPAPNLFGDGAPASVFRLTTLYGWMDGLYLAARPSAAGVTLYPIYSHWWFDFGEDTLPPPSDQNGDGQPEVAVVLGGHSGTMCYYHLGIFQWQVDHFASLSTNAANPNGISLNDCVASWSYGLPNTAGRPTLDTVSLEFPTIERHYVWQEEGYALQQAAPPAPRSADDFAEDWLSFTWEAGDYGSVAARLAASRARWPNQPFSEYYGTVYPLYLRFQQGLTKIFQGDQPGAQADFQAVISRTSALKKPALGLAAQAYLEAYTGPADLYRACEAALDPMRTALAEQTATGLSESEAHMAAWGYGPESDHDELCSLRAALMALVRQWTPADLAAAPAALQTVGVRVSAAEQFDLDGDGTLEWVVVVGTGNPYAPWEAYVLLNAATGPRALPVVAWEDRPWFNSDTPLTAAPLITRLDLPGSTPPIILADVGGPLHAFRLQTVASEPHVLEVLSVSLSATYQFVPNGDSVSLEVTTTGAYCTPCLETYDWDVDMLAFYRRSAPYSPSVAWDQMLAAEALLFDPARRAEAQALYAAAFTTAEDYERPRLLYGQALAAELDGDAPRAASLYWQLWHDYPGSIYGFTAREKLMPMP